MPLARGSTAMDSRVKKPDHSVSSAQSGITVARSTMKASGRKTWPTRMMVAQGGGVVGAQMGKFLAAIGAVIDLLEITGKELAVAATGAAATQTEVGIVSPNFEIKIL